MINLLEFNLINGDKERSIYLSPVLMQAGQMPSLTHPFKAYVYEDLVKETWRIDPSLFSISDTPSPASEEFKERFSKERIRIKHDQDFGKAYLGYLIKLDENLPWRFDGNLNKLNEDEIQKLEDFINNYSREDTR